MLLENTVVSMHRHLNYDASGLLLSLPKYRAAERHVCGRMLEPLPWIKLGHKAHDTADSLSYGDQCKLKLARALATEPKLLLLGEPVVGMNTGEKVDLMAKIENTKARGYTIFTIEYDMCFVTGPCECTTVLNFSRIIAEGSPEAIRNDPQVIETYLGRDDNDDANGDVPQRETV